MPEGWGKSLGHICLFPLFSFVCLCDNTVAMKRVLEPE